MCIFYLGKIEFRGFTKISISHDPVSHHINITIYVILIYIGVLSLQ